MRKLNTLVLLFIIFSFKISTAQVFDQFFADIVDNTSYDSIVTNLEYFEELGIKSVGSESLENTFQWLKAKYEEYGYQDIEIDTFYYANSRLYNLIVTKRGTKYPDKYLIVDAHYDTYGGPPGCNDNGSGTIIVSEIARLLKNISTEYSIKFIHFSAEELGLVGSRHYVDYVVTPQNMDILLVFNIDEVGGVQSLNNNVITCERDEGSPTTNNAASYAYTDTLALCVEAYSSLSTVFNYAYGSDYVPFEDAGKIITGLYEYNESSDTHSLNDSVKNLDLNYIYEITKASVGATLYFSNENSNVSTTIREFTLATNFSVYPNPVKDILNINLENYLNKEIVIRVVNIYGQVVYENNFFVNNKIESIDFSHLNEKMYLLNILDDKKSQTKKILKSNY